VIPHSDGAGGIDAVGPDVPNARIGERVQTWNAQWGHPFGTTAEFVAPPSAQAVRLPDASTLRREPASAFRP
jgi:NADPH2:quinone reductase